MLKSLFSGILICIVFTDLHAQSITQEEAKKLTASLAASKPDGSQLNNLLVLARYHILKPGENKTDLDSAVNLIDRAAALNQTLKSNIVEGNILLIKSLHLKESGQRDTARKAAEQAVAILKNEADKKLTGEAYMELASYYDYNDSKALIQRIELVKLAVNSYAQSGNTQQRAASLQMLGDLYNIHGSSYLALQHLQESLDTYKSIQYAQVQGIYCLMGFINARLRDFRRALDFEQLALKTAESVGDSSMQLCQIYNYLGEICNGLAEKEQAIYYYEKALEVAKRHDDHFAIYLASVNIANVWAALNKPNKALDLMKSISSQYEKPTNNNLDYNIARCYIGSYCLLKQYEKARPYANQLLQMVNTLNMHDNANISAYTVAVRFFISAGEETDARKYLDKHGELAKKLNNFYYLAANQKLRFMLDTSRRDYHAATAHLLEYNRLNDSVALEIKNRQIGELQVQFDTEKKERAIAAKDKDIQLLTEQSNLQQARIKNDRLMRNFMIAAAVFLLLTLALVYSRYLIKQKSNRILNGQRAHINEQNLSLQAMVREQEKLIDEKEWLLKEIHHRVKNNLQIVMSLLNSQSAFIDNEAALTAIHDSQHRVHAMSLIHQKLYNTENVSTIDLLLYIRELVSYLADSFNTGQRIRFEFDIEPLEMDVSQAVPLGLILNEAITNAIKYAFPNGRNGMIAITLGRPAPDRCQLWIADNGIGIPPGYGNKMSGSLGMSMMKGLSEDLDGNISIVNNNGTIIKISFAYELAVKRGGTYTISFALIN